MFDAMFKQKEDMTNRTKYTKHLGWHEFDDDGDKTPAVIFVLDTSFGYGVFRQGMETESIFWSKYLDEAVEWAVDRARSEISDHEIKQQERQPKELDHD